MLKEMLPVSIDTVVGETAKIKVDGYRFVTISCTALDENTLEILYHFDKELRLKHLRLTVSKDTAVPSISAVYLAAFLVENEIQDLFGIHFEGLVIDYDRTLYLDEEVTVTPFCKYTATESPKEVNPPTPESVAMSKSEEL